MLIIIDGDSLIYTAAFRCQVTETRDKWSRTEVTCTEDEAKDQIRRFIGEVLDHVDPRGDSPSFLYLTDSAPSYRDQIARTRKYKGNRDGVSRPIYYWPLREFITGEYGAISVFGEEADDLVSVRAHTCRKEGTPYCVVGNDKDLNQIPGRHYNWQSGEDYELSETESRMWFWMQVLMGDAGDNIGGVWKTGFQKAKNRVQQWITKEKLSDDRIFPLVCEEFERSKKLPGCPYRQREASKLAEEAYWLVHLKTTKDDLPWIKRMSETRGNYEKQEQKPETDTSGFAQVAEASEVPPWDGPDLLHPTHAQSATDSGTQREAGAQATTEP